MITEYEEVEVKPIRYQWNGIDITLTGANAWLYRMCKIIYGDKAEAEFMKLFSHTDEL